MTSRGTKQEAIKGIRQKVGASILSCLLAFSLVGLYSPLSWADPQDGTEGQEAPQTSASSQEAEQSSASSQEDAQASASSQDADRHEASDYEGDKSESAETGTEGLISAAEPGHAEEGESQAVYNLTLPQTALSPFTSALPNRYDARDDGLISPVRLQDPWGACWAFASLSAMEANLVKQGLESKGVHLSPRHLVNFAGTPVGEDAGSQAGEGQHPIKDLIDLYGNNAVFELGGHAMEVASAISSGEGVVLESLYPFKNDEGYANERSYEAEGTWTLQESERYSNTLYTLRNMLRFSNPSIYSDYGDINTWSLDWNAVEAIKQAILDYGAVSISYCSSDGTQGGPNYYDPNNYTYFTNETSNVDHDVCIVGWDDAFPRDLFTTGAGGSLPEYDGAWIVKNSWGASSETFPNKNDWGKEGYFYLSYCDRSAQGFTAWDMMPLETSITNQHDYMGQRSNAETRISSYEPQAFANVFVAQQSQKLEAVSVNTYAPNTRAIIQLYLLDEATAKENLDPRSGILLEKKDIVFYCGGYHRVELDYSYEIKKGQYFSLVVSLIETDEDGNDLYVASIEAGNNERYVNRLGLSHYDTVICNEGETRVYISLDGAYQWVDGAVFARLLNEDAADGAWYGNACLKVFANPVDDPEPEPDPEPDPKPDPDPEPDPEPEPTPEPEPDPEPEPEPDPEPDPEPTPAPQKEVVNNAATAAPVRTTANTADTNNVALLVFLLFVSASSGAVARIRGRA